MFPVRENGEKRVFETENLLLENGTGYGKSYLKRAKEYEKKIFFKKK